MRLAVIEITQHGGHLHYSAQLAENLGRRGHSVDLIVPARNELLDRTRHVAMRPVLPAGLGTTGERRPGIRHHLRRVATATRLVRAWSRILWEASRRRYDALVTGADIYTTLTATACLLLTVRPSRPPLIFICHNARPVNRWAGADVYREPRVLTGLLRRLFPRFDLVVVHGERTRAEFEAAWPPTPLAIVPHGDERIFADEPPPPADEEHILFFGEWRKGKGLELLMDAFDELAQRRPGVRLTIAGRPMPIQLDPEPIRRWARGHGERVRLIDRYVPIEQVPELFGEARVVATPYTAGSQSGINHIAATMARPVVTSDVGDIPAAVADGETGRVVAAGDREALVDSLEELVSDAELAERLGAEARRRMLQGSSWSAVAERLESEILGVLVRNGSGPAR